MDDYGYVGIDFRQDLDLVLPDYDDWDASLGKKHVISLHAKFIYMFLDIIMLFLHGIRKHYVYDFQIVCQYDQRGCPQYNTEVHRGLEKG